MKYTNGVLSGNSINGTYTIYVDGTFYDSGTFSLTITKTGTGSGAVSASSGTISWNGSTGTANYSSGTSVTLTAAPAGGSTFSGWSGACTGTGSCVLNMDASKSVTATFSTSWVGSTAFNAYDCNGDGKSDLIWRQASTGLTVMALMNGATITSQTLLGGSTDWSVLYR